MKIRFLLLVGLVGCGLYAKQPVYAEGYFGQAKKTKLKKEATKKVKQKSTKKAEKKKTQKKEPNKKKAPQKKQKITKPPSNLQEVDGIAAVIYGKEDTLIITKSEVKRPSLDGSMPTLDDLVLRRLMYLDAKKHNMLPTDDDVDKHLASVQKNYNLDLNQIKEMFRDSGYSYQEGRDQFAMTTAVQSIIDFKIMSRLIVPESEVKAYYDAHPEVEQAAYQLQVSVIPYKGDRDAQRAALEKRVAQKRKNDSIKPDGISWSSPFWIDHSDVSEEKEFIFTMKKGGVSAPQKTDRGFEIIKLLDKRPERKRPFNDRYREIADILRQPKYLELLEEYKKELHASASVVYF